MSHEGRISADRIRAIVRSALLSIDPAMVILPMPGRLLPSILGTGVNPEFIEGQGTHDPSAYETEQQLFDRIANEVQYFFTHFLVPFEPGLGCALSVDLHDDVGPWLAYRIRVSHNIVLN